MSRRGRPKVKLKSQKRQQLDESTRFHIDYSWWDEKGLSLESYLNSRLGQSISLDDSLGAIDLVDMTTGEVRQLSGFEYAVQKYFQDQPIGDFSRRASLVDAVFCALLANGNRPMTAGELGAEVQRAPDTILKTLSGPKVFQGIRVHKI